MSALARASSRSSCAHRASSEKEHDEYMEQSHDMDKHTEGFLKRNSELCVLALEGCVTRLLRLLVGSRR